MRTVTSMSLRRAWLVAFVGACCLATVLGVSRGEAQTPQPAANGVADPNLSLRLAQKAGSPGTQVVEITISSAYPVQVRLFENGTLLLFDGFTSTTPGTVSRAYARDCGRRYSYDLYAVVNGGVAATQSASITLCPDAQATPTPAAGPAAAPATAAATRAAAAAPAPPPPAPAAAAPSRSTRMPGEPPVPAPPLEPPSQALSGGFVLAEPDDMAAASAAVSGTSYLRVLAIWLRGTDSGGQGGGDYQYVQIANLGGAAQDLTGWALQGDSGPISGLTFYFPDGFTLDAGASCRIYVGHPAEDTCTGGSFALFHFWGDHGTASLWDSGGALVDSLPY